MVVAAAGTRTGKERGMSGLEMSPVFWRRKGWSKVRTAADQDREDGQGDASGDVAGSVGRGKHVCRRGGMMNGSAGGLDVVEKQQVKTYMA